MAPRGRARKVGLKRIDAAIDALRPLGFAKDMIRKTVNALLKIYGDEGWVFIEEASYKLLIETILEEQERGLVVKDDTCKNGSKALESIEPLVTASASEVGVGETRTVPEVKPLESIEHLAAASASEVVGVGETRTVPEVMQQLATVKGSHEVVSCRHILNFDHGSKLEQIDWVQVVQPLSTPALQRRNKRRKPCYGWISDDDDDDDEEEDTQMELGASQKGESIQSMGHLSGGRKRKTCEARDYVNIF